MKAKNFGDIVYRIRIELVQNCAMIALGRLLTPREITRVAEELEGNQDDLEQVIMEAIQNSTFFNALDKRNKKAETRPVHYLVFWRNRNIFHNDYEKVFSGITEKDARKFIKLQAVGIPFDKYKIVKVENGIQIDIEEIGKDYPEDGKPPNEAEWIEINKNMEQMDRTVENLKLLGVDLSK